MAGFPMIAGHGSEARVTGAEIIAEILRNMEESLEPLKYSVLAPGVYRVYLHPQDFERLRGVFPRIKEEARRALDEALGRLNRPPRLPQAVSGLADRLRIRLGGEKLRFESATGGWELSFHSDPEEELAAGDVLVASELAYAVESGRGAGTATRRIVTRRGEAGSRAEVSERTGQASAGVLAHLYYEDASGRQCFEMTKDQIVIGRGSATHWCDLQLEASRDVSREHARLRHEPATGRFFLKDMSSLGTTVDGHEVASSIAEENGGKRDRNVEVELPRTARIGLAGVLYLRFEAGSERTGGAP
jgi:hypothetical protein